MNKWQKEREDIDACANQRKLFCLLDVYYCIMVLKILSKKKYSPSEVIELLSIYWVCSLTKPITDNKPPNIDCFLKQLRVVFEPPSINCTCLLKWLIHCSWFYTSRHTLSMLTHWFTGQLKVVFESTTIDWVCSFTHLILVTEHAEPKNKDRVC